MLETRQLFSAAPSASWFASQGFESINWHGKSTYVAPNEFLLKLNRHSVSAATAALTSLGSIDVKRDLDDDGTLLINSSLDFGQVQKLAKKLPGFKFVEPNFALYADNIPNDPQFGSLYGMDNTGQTGGTPDDDIDAPEAWDLTTGSSNVVVGIIDTGIDYNHPDLAANVWTNTGEIPGDGIDNDNDGYIDDIHGYDFVNNDGDPFDDNMHGTHVAGTIGAVGNNGVGVAGVNWNVKIMAIKFLNASGSGSTDAAVSALHYANVMKSKGVNIRLTSNSWGGGGFSQAMLDEINASAANNMLFIAAAGNSSVNTDLTPNYPSNYDAPNVISVAATDQNDALASFSNYGALTVDLGAPGVNILSTTPNNTYSTLSGTSMATPHVSGVAALAFGIAPNASYQTVKDALLNGGDPVASLAGKSVTGKRLNAFGTLQLMGLTVIGSTPANGATVASAPTQFTINFSFPIDPASLNASDLKVNGISANSFSFNAGTPAQAVFNYNTSPVSAQGLQSMSIAAGTIARASDASPIAAWSASFRYDTTTLAVTSTSPTNGLTVTPLPLTTLDINFNEPIDPASVGIDDLSLGTGSVIAAQVLDADTARYTLTGLSAEGTLAYTLAAGKVTDQFGNPGNAFSGSLNLEAGTVALSSTWNALTPIGSRAYDQTVASKLDFTGDVDTYAVTLAAGSTFAALVTPTGVSSISPTIQVFDPGSALLGTFTAQTPGAPAGLAKLVAAAGGTYTIKVFDSGNKSGDYSMRVVLNGSLENESVAGTSNNSIATAQNIDTLLSTASSIAPNTKLAAIAGDSRVQTVFSTNFESGAAGFTVNNGTSGLWHLSTGRGSDAGHSATHSFYYGRNEGPGGGGTYDTGALTTGSIDSPSIALPASGKIQLDFNYKLQTENSTSWDFSQVQISANGGSTYTTLTSYNGVAEGGFQAATSIDLSAYAGQTVKLRWFFNTVDGVFNNFEGWYVDDIKVTATGSDADYYAVTLATGDTLSVAADKPTGSVTMQLLNGGGTTLASGVAATNAEQILSYTAPSGGVYYVKATFDSAGPYTLAVVRNGDFEKELNDQPSTPGTLGSSKTVIGAIGVADNDSFIIPLTTGQQITFRTDTPSVPHAALDPKLTIYNSSNVAVATDDNSAADGRNAVLNFTASATDNYRIVVTGVGSTTGEYTLAASTVAQQLVANPGGPYSASEGGSVQVSGAGSSGPITSYEWDFDYDGQTFNVDATGVSPTLDLTNADGPATRTIALRVSSGGSPTAPVSTTVSIANANPTSSFAGSTVTLGNTGFVGFIQQTDPSPADRSGFKYSYDFDNNGTFEITDSINDSATVPAQYLSTVGPHVVKGRIKDKDGGFNDYTATVQVNPASGTTQLSGTIIGTTGSYKGNPAVTRDKAFDGDLATYFDAPTSNGNWVGLDLGVGANGTGFLISEFRFAPRSNYANRMTGGKFQGSNTADFSSGVVTLFTIASTPPVGVLTSATISNNNGFRYVRYLAPNGSFGNIAEMQVFGTSAPAAQPPPQQDPKLSGTVIGTSGSYLNDPNRTRDKAFDGDPATYFDAATANGNWVGLDLGSTKKISRIRFTPRASYAARMVGGKFQASNTADFSSGVVDLLTITSTPASGWNDVNINNAGTFRYVRYLSPVGSYGNVAEIEFYGA